MEARSLARLLADRCSHSPEADLLRLPGGDRWSYEATLRRADRFATVLADAGARPGSVVVVQVDKSPDAVCLYLACLRSGLVFCPLNPAFTRAETDWFLDDARPCVAVVRPGQADTTSAPAVLELGVAGDGSLAEAAARATPRPGIVDRAPGEVAALLYTSGTTGRPKGAEITDANLVANLVSLTTAWGWRPDDVLVHTLPLFHVHGLFVALHCALWGAGPLWLVDRFDTTTVLDLLPRATVLMGVPTHYRRLLDDPRLGPERCRGMRLFLSGSAPLPKATHDEFTSRTGHRIVERYGMTETGILTSNPLDGGQVAGTVGYPLPGVEVRVVAPDGATGPVEVRGDNVFTGYRGRADATEQAFTSDGWFITGDVGRLDATGRLTLEGRAGDLIITGGENVSPKELEEILDGLPGVAEAAVVGLAHRDFGEAVTAILVAAGDAADDDAVEAALGAAVARFKQPKRLVWVDELPRNSMGKIQKAVLREQFRDLYDD